MGYQENLELYLNLSRRELQGLCKKNNLPANRSHTELANSLASLFKKRNDSPAPLKDRLNTPEELSYDKTYMLDTKSNKTTNHSEGNTKGSDSHKVSPFMKEKGGDHGQHTSTGNQMEISRHVGGKAAVGNPYKIASNTVFPNNEVLQLFTSTTSGDGNGNPETDGRLSSKCNTDGTNSGANKLPDLKKFGQKLLNPAASNREVHKLASAQNTQQGAAECHSKSGFLSPQVNAPKATPSFQFFVECNEGFHLFVDLNSRPAEWVSSLRDGVRESLKSKQYKSRTFPNHSGDCTAVDGSLISTPENIGINLQSNGDTNSSCTASTLSSITDVCQSVGSQPDATIVSSESYVLTSSRLPVEISGSLDGNQVISSSFATYSNVQKVVPFDTTCSPENGIGFPHNLIDASRMDECNTLGLDTSVKPIGSISDTSTETKKAQTQLECPTLNNATDGSSSIGANTSGHQLGNCFEIENDNTTSDNLKIGNGTCYGSKERGPEEGSLGVTGNHSRSSSACQLGGKLIPDLPVTEVQSDAGLPDLILSLHACIVGDSIAKDPAAALNDELDKMTPVKEIENSPDENSKRSHSDKFQEEFQNKRHRSNDGNKSGLVVNLRSARTSAKETISEPVLHPRRSSRFLTK